MAGSHARQRGACGPGTVGWQLSGMNGPTPFAAAAQFYSFGVFQNPDFNFHAMDIGSAVKLARKNSPSSTTPARTSMPSLGVVANFSC